MFNKKQTERIEDLLWCMKMVERACCKEHGYKRGEGVADAVWQGSGVLRARIAVGGELLVVEPEPALYGHKYTSRSTVVLHGDEVQGFNDYMQKVQKEAESLNTLLDAE